MTSPLPIPHDLPAGGYHVVVELTSAADSNRSNDRTFPPDTAPVDISAPVARTLDLHATLGGDVSAEAGDRDVVVLGVTARAPAGGPDVSVSALTVVAHHELGATGAVGATDAVDTDALTRVRLHLDERGSGTLDGAVELAFTPGFNVRGEAVLTLERPLVIAVGTEAMLLVTVDVEARRGSLAVPAPSAALPLVPVSLLLGSFACCTGRRRRLAVVARRALLVALILVPLLAACNPAKLDPPKAEDPPELEGRRQVFVMELRAATATAEGAPVTTPALPLTGATLHLTLP
jgi:hypothetical protein